MTPYTVFAEVIAAGLQPSFQEAWFDFETWERCRNFRDDPDCQSKAVLDWVRDLYDLSVSLEEFDDTPNRRRCSDTIEACFKAFAQMDHTTELCEAIVHWKGARLAAALGESLDATPSRDN